jgi:oxygen-independent coproporphyrinogen-3 oxidase
LTGLYIHIPYCRQACHYCDFHFSTNLKTKPNLIEAIKEEIKVKSDQQKLSTIYFGGGTPSLLSVEELAEIFNEINKSFAYNKDIEITLEANPEDLSSENLGGWRNLGVNRLSIGIQSFDDQLLRGLNRVHSSKQAITGIQQSMETGITNLSVDLMYGIPGSNKETWSNDLQILKSMEVPHVSIYGLTIEEKTVFGNWHKRGKIAVMTDDDQAKIYEQTHSFLAAQGFEHYEVSNYAKPGFRSKHNTSYWQQKAYIGIGPGAHSYTGKTRTYNVRNNSRYIQKEGNATDFKESVDRITEINEYIMTRTRTDMGLDMDYMMDALEIDLLKDRTSIINELIKSDYLVRNGRHLITTWKGFLLADEIALKLFYD